MTENVDSASLLNQSSHLETSVSVSSNCNTIVSQLDGTVFLNPNMMVENSCLYTTADLSGTFPEGTVLQILPDSTILAVPPIKELSNTTSSNATIVFKDSSFGTELIETQDPSTVSSMLVESADAAEPLVSEVAIEGNITDLDLSFLNDAVESDTVSSSKNLTDASIKDLQRMMAAAAAESFEDVLQSNLPNSITENKDLEQPVLSENPPEDVVMIDVSKPIQLSQNSLIMVNGQKCVLQQDPQTGQVIAYPVKEQDKPRRRRGRPRKSSVGEQNSLDSSQNSESPPETENASDEGKEKGLLEVIADDGSLVRRSSRKRKKAKVLKDYETGNLKQELGSDVEDENVGELDLELLSRRKKAKNVGRPRKYPLPPLEKKVSEPPVNGIKRPRGRPRKQVPTAEPTQAFLVQTVDGQTLMMQVPMSSIPQGLSLQEVAQNIANKLNLSLSQANNTVTDLGNLFQPLEKGINDQSLGLVSESSVLDQSVDGALSSVEEQLPPDHTSISNMENVVTSVHENILISGEGAQSNCNESDAFLSEHQEQLATIEIPATSDESLPVSTSSSFINTSSVLNSLPESFGDPMAGAKQDEQDIENSFSQFQMPKDFLISGDFMKEKMNLQQLLANVVNSSSDSQLTESCLDHISASALKDSNASSVQEFLMRDNCALKDFESEFTVDVGSGKQSVPESSAEFDSRGKRDKSYDFLNCDLTDSALDSNVDKSAILGNSIISSIEHDHNLLAQPKSKEKIQTEQEPRVSSFQPILPMGKITSLLTSAASDTSFVSTPTATVMPVSSGQQLEMADKLLPIVLSKDLPGSKKCKVCKRPYFTDEELVKHYKAEHPKCICTHCNYMADHAYVIKRHSIRHSDKVIACHLCGKQYKDHYILKIHIKMVHLPAEVIFTCEICEKQFNRKAHLKRHLRIHAPHRQYKCSFCNYRGCEKSDITKHRLIHEAPKHKCHLCDKAFRHLKNKELHLKRHYKQRDYKCGICNFYGYTFTDIRKHIERRHADMTGNTCSECSSVFNSGEELEEHRNSGQCLGNSVEPKLELDDSLHTDESNESQVLEEMPLDMLESEPPQNIVEVNTTSGEKLDSVQPNQLILNPTDSVLSAQNGQIVINGLDAANLLPSENLSFLTMPNETSKMITLVTSDGKNFMLPIKAPSATESYNQVVLREESNNEESFQTGLSFEIDDPS